ncbi:MAG: hypothetical protein R8G01_06565 [Ilumatobacteraceae bacterium]|nr:hypothetical protein [Ilumatobacteraceae bacterium]
MDDPVEPDADAWPPAVFRPAGPSPTNPPRLVARRFELVDVGADAADRTASIDIVVLGRVWVVVGCVGPSAEWISRLVAEVAVDAVRHGAARLTVGPGCPPEVEAVVLDLGGHTDEFGVVIDL